MRRVVLVMLCAFALSGCISTLDGAYDRQAHRQCENEEARNRADCHDRADRHRQQRERD